MLRPIRHAVAIGVLILGFHPIKLPNSSCARKNDRIRAIHICELFGTRHERPTGSRWCSHWRIRLPDLIAFPLLRIDVKNDVGGSDHHLSHLQTIRSVPWVTARDALDLIGASIVIFVAER